MKTVRVDRSRVEQYQRCPRSRYLQYHQSGTGIESAKKPLPLAVGGSVHEGLAELLRGKDEEQAVATALEDFAQHRGTLALDTTELAQQAAGAQVVPDDQMRADLAASLGLDVNDTAMAALQHQAGQGAKEFDDYLWQEQSALVEGLVRAYARRRLRPLLEQYEVLEVEREGEWELSRWGDVENYSLDTTLMFMSRPDALLRDRTDNSLYILSFKTAASWDVRKARDAQHDMQGLSEGVEVERRLAEWWENIEELAGRQEAGDIGPDKSAAMLNYLRDLPAPPRILGIRYEYLLKGDRWKDRDLSARVGFDARVQKSHLVRQYVATSVPKSKGESAYHHGDVCWSWEWLKPDGTESKLAWQNWSSRPVWDQPGGVRGWIDALDASAMTMSPYDSTVGMEPREMGWGGPAQALGTTKDHPLDTVFIPPIIVYRNDDDLRDWIEQVEAQERRVAEAVSDIRSLHSADGDRSLLNRYFPQTRRACEYPSTCQFVPVCYGGEDIRMAPLASGRYVARVPNHPMELVSIKEADNAK